MSLSRNLGFILLTLACAASCTGDDTDGGSQTNWGRCTTDADCSQGMTCVAERCQLRDSGLVRDAIAPDSGPADGSSLSEAGSQVSEGGSPVPEGGSRVPIEEVQDLQGRFGLAYRTIDGNAAFLEYVDGNVTVTPLGVPGTPRFTYDPIGQAIFVVPAATREDMTRINAAVVPSLDVPLVFENPTNATTVEIVAAGPGLVRVRNDVFYYDETGNNGEYLAGSFDDIRREELTAGRDGYAYLSFVAGSGPIPDTAYVSMPNTSPWGTAWKIADGGVSGRNAVAADGTIHVIHYCSTTTERSLVGRLCYASSPEEGQFADGGADTHPNWTHATLGEVYEEVDMIEQGCVPVTACPPQITTRPLQAAIALDANDQPHTALLRPAGGAFRVAYQPAPLTGAEPENLALSDPLTPPTLHVGNDGTVHLVAHDSPTRFTLYVKNANGWHATHVDVPDLDIVGSVEIQR